MDRARCVVDHDREGINRRAAGYAVVQLPVRAARSGVIRWDLELEQKPARVEDVARATAAATDGCGVDQRPVRGGLNRWTGARILGAHQQAWSRSHVPTHAEVVHVDGW